jgi:SAM-dependent methyltransferase
MASYLPNAQKGVFSMNDLALEAGGDFNLVPYVSRPFPQSQPSRLAALAKMFGLAAPEVSRCRVLELGCAAGGNIIPFAVRFPGSQVRGIDLTERHVREGQARIKVLGLDNIRIEQGDIAASDLSGELFDYIICHGVYSWVPPAVRDAILRVSAENLTADGVAYISYNVYPGWQMRGVIRDMMIYHAGLDGDPKMRIAKARWVLDNIAKSSRGGTPYGDMLRGEAKALARMDDSYILGEFLAPENAPCYFRDFAAKAKEHGLVYLCEAELNQCIPEHMGAEVGAMMRVMSRDNLLPLEQYIFKGRTFRQTLLVRAAREPKIKRKLLPERARGLHVSGRMTSSIEADGSSVFKDAKGGTLATRHPGVRDALHRLSEAFPATRTVAELIAEGAAPTRKATADLERALLDAVFKLIVFGLVDVSTAPMRPGNAAGDRPKAWSLSRLDGLEGNNWTTSPAHNFVALDVVCTALLPFLDGTHSRDDLRMKLLAAVDEGRIRFQDNTTGGELEGERLEAAAVEHVNLALNKMASAGLLE